MDKTDKLLEWAGEAGVEFKPSPRDLYASLWLGELEHIVDLATTGKDREISDLQSRLSAAEKERDEAKAECERRFGIGGELIIARRERDEALAYAENLRIAIDDFLVDRDPANHGEVCQCEPDTGYYCHVCRFANDPYHKAMGDALATPAPAALSHLRQEIRREAFREVLTEWEKPWGLAQSPFIDRLRRLAEQEKQG